MEISQEQISACETLIMMEDQYLTAIQEGGNNDENRKTLEPLRKAMHFLKTEYGLDDTTRSLYDKYTRLMRAGLIYGDMLNNLQDNDQSNENTD